MEENIVLRDQERDFDVSVSREVDSQLGVTDYEKRVRSNNKSNFHFPVCQCSLVFSLIMYLLNA